MNRLDVSIVVPAFNEELLIADFLKNISKICGQLQLKYELIIVENGSTDSTWELIQKEAARNFQIVPIRLTSAGYGSALIRAFQEAKGKYVVIFNVDYWDSRFLALTKINLLEYDLIVASKVLPGAVDKRVFTRRLITRILSLFLRLFLGYKGTDTHGVKVFRFKQVSKIISQCKLRNGIFDSELLIRSERANLNILELPAEVQDVRPARFSLKRILETPIDIFLLWKVLR